MFDSLVEIENAQTCIKHNIGSVIDCPSDSSAIVAALSLIADRLNAIHEDLESIAATQEKMGDDDE